MDDIVSNLTTYLKKEDAYVSKLYSFGKLTYIVKIEDNIFQIYSDGLDINGVEYYIASQEARNLFNLAENIFLLLVVREAEEKLVRASTALKKAIF